MKTILMKKLKYKCTRKPMLTCAYYGMYFYMKDTHLPLMAATNDISWAMHSKVFYSEFIESLKISSIFADAPWYYLYPFYDQLIPRNHSKYILTVRDSTRDVVNSNMKMFVRNIKRRRKLNETLQFDYTNVSQYLNPKWVGIKTTWEEFWMLNARNYEIHTRNVIDYFTKQGRLDDLLVINLGQESKKNESEQWYKITEFLGCGNMSAELPKTMLRMNIRLIFFQMIMSSIGGMQHCFQRRKRYLILYRRMTGGMMRGDGMS